MHTFAFVLAAALCLAAASALPAAAADFYLEPVATAGDPPSDQAAAVSETIRNTLQRDGHRVAANPSANVFILRPKLIREGENYTVTLEKVLNGQVSYAAKTGPSARSALQGNVDLLTRSAVAGSPAGEPGQASGGVVQTVTVAAPAAAAAPPPPAEEPKRDKPVNQWQLGFGPAWVNEAAWEYSGGPDKGGVKPMVSLAHIWNIDKSNAAIKLFAESTFIDGDDRLVNGGLGATWFLTREDISPFLSADLGYGVAIRDRREEEDGFMFGGAVGAQFFRTNEVSMDLALRVTSMAQRLERESPVVYGLRLGLNF